jgi:hypothetical protein
MKVISTNLYRAILLDGLLSGLSIAFGLSACAASQHQDSHYAAGLEAIAFVVTFVAWLAVNAWGVYLMHRATPTTEDAA